jgi:cold shock CspA family protein
MPRGKIKKVLERRGFGFITRHHEKDLFVHASDWEEPYMPFDQRIVGRMVEFDVVPSSEGPRAVNVRIIDEQVKK